MCRLKTPHSSTHLPYIVSIVRITAQVLLDVLVERMLSFFAYFIETNVDRCLMPMQVTLSQLIQRWAAEHSSLLITQHMAQQAKLWTETNHLICTSMVRVHTRVERQIHGWQ